MGTIATLESGVMDAVGHTIPFLDDYDAICLSEAVLAPKPPPRPIDLDLFAHFADDDVPVVLDPLMICSLQ